MDACKFEESLEWIEVVKGKDKNRFYVNYNACSHKYRKIDVAKEENPPSKAGPNETAQKAYTWIERSSAKSL